MSEPTVEEMVFHVEQLMIDLHVEDPYRNMRKIKALEAIREALTEYEELKKKLSEVKFDVQNPNRLDIQQDEPKVSREWIYDVAMQMAGVKLQDSFKVLEYRLAERGIIVEPVAPKNDNHEAKEGE